MAGEIGITLRVRTTKDNFKADYNPGSQSIDQNAVGSDGGVVTVSTGGTTLSMSKLDTLGVFSATNTDASNFVTIGPSTSTGSAPHLYQKFKPGESHVLRLHPGVIVRGIADTAAVKLQFEVLED
jgi:hypothetical protein